MDPIGQHLLQQADDEEQQRLARYKAAWQAYHGKLPDPLKVRAGKPNDNLKVNYARLVIDLGVTMLFGKDVRFELDSQAADNPAEQWLNAAWQHNKKLTLLQKLAMNGGVCGTPFIKIALGTPYPRLINLDPAMVCVHWNDEDIDDAEAYEISWSTIDRSTKPPRPLLKRQRIVRERPAPGITRWRIIDEQRRTDQQQWLQTGNALWRFPWAPIVHAQNLPAANEFWGIADLEDDLIGLNKGMNFLLSNMARIIRFHAHPKTWGKGFQANELQIAVDETIVLPSMDAALNNLEMQGDLTSSLAVYNEVRQALHAIARVPEVAAGKFDNLGQLSGLALKVLYGPLVGKTETKQQTYGDLLVTLNERLLELGGFGREQITKLHWPELLPADELQQRNVLLLDKQLGASTDTVLQKAGYDPDSEREKREHDQEQLGSALLTAFDRNQTISGQQTPTEEQAQ